MTSTRRLGSLLAALALLGGAVACSSSSEESTTANRDQASRDDSGSPGGAGGLGDIPNLGGLGDCIAVSAAYGQLWMAHSLGMGQLSEADLQQMQAQIEQLKGNVPDEIKDDLAIVTEAFTRFSTEVREGLGSGGFMNPDDPERVEAASEIMDAPEVQAADDRIKAYLQESCS